MSDSPEQREAERYPQIVRAIRDTPWAMLESAFETLVEVVDRRLKGEHLAEEEIKARVGNRAASRPSNLVGSVEVIPIYGAIIPKATVFSEMSGGTSIQGLQADFRDALANEDVKAIVFDIDSPGGMTDGVPELAAEIRAARGQKPIVSVANYRAASAAFWLGAMADEFVASPSADVGSVGVFAAHKAVAGMEEKLGVKTTLIAEPAGKIEGSPFQDLTPEAETMIRERVSEMYDTFVGDIAKGRGVSVGTVKSDYGGGRMLSAAKALKARMIDRVDTLESVVARLQNPSGRSRVANGTISSGIEVVYTGAVPSVEQVAAAAEVAAEGAQTRKFSDAVDEAHRAIEAVVSGAEALRALTGTKREQLTALIGRAEELVAKADEAEQDPESDGLELELAWQLGPRP